MVVTVPEDAGAAFDAALAASTGDRVRLPLSAWNGTVVELGSLATVLSDPVGNFSGGSAAEVRFLARTNVDARRPVVSSDPAGRPVLGLSLLTGPATARDGRVFQGIGALRVDAFSTTSTEIVALRAKTQLAIWDVLHRRPAVGSSERSSGAVPWAVVSGVVIVGALIAAYVYNAQSAEIARREAVEIQALRNSARATEGRLQVLARTGTLPPPTPEEEAARDIINRRAEATRSSAAIEIANVLREAGKAASNWLLIAAVLAGGYLVLKGDRNG